LNGERDLARLLAALDPQLHAERYSFSVTTDPRLADGDFAIIREAEGLTAIGPDPSGEWARISLSVHSSLDAVGLTATIATRLAERGISANVIAAFHHDHFFVQWDLREVALEALRS
jgi:hypothetical protein